MSFDFIENRDPAQYFHGRTEMIDTFTRALDHYQRNRGGTTFLIQGAPGVGKTALLHEFKKRAVKKWKIADIYPNALWSPDVLLDCLGKSRGQIASWSGKTEVEASNLGHASPALDARPTTSTMMKILRNGTKPLLLILDEAQNLGIEGVVPKEMRGGVTGLLDKIHNGKLGRPVMLLAAGLGTTEFAFDLLGISRFEGESLINLGRLDKDSEYNVIRDWLTEAGGAIDDPTPWIETISEQTHGWPQHIISYVKPAASYLKSNSHRMTNEGLRFILEKGNEFRINYYETRAQEFSLKKRQVIASFIPDLQQSGYLEKENILDVLTPKYGEEKSEKFFDDMLHSGILSHKPGGVYDVPIPSMQTWLFEEYGREQIKMIEIEDESSEMRSESLNQEKDSSEWSR